MKRANAALLASAGTAPDTAAVIKSFETTETDDDVNFLETVLKALLQARPDALADVSGEIIAFLAGP